MGNLNVNFGSGKGTVYSNQNSENSLYSLLKGNQGNSNLAVSGFLGLLVMHQFQEQIQRALGAY